MGGTDKNLKEIVRGSWIGVDDMSLCVNTKVVYGMNVSLYEWHKFNISDIFAYLRF